jgi:sec-independent protein translocase protein TatB
MFGMGGTEILVILVVAMIFLGPDKLPEAAAKLSKGIRDIRKQQRELTQTIENDTEIGGAIRELKSALRGDEVRRPPVRKQPPAEAQTPPGPASETVAAELPAAPAVDPAAEANAAPVGGVDALPAAEPDDAMKLIRPATGTAARTPIGAPLAANADDDKSDA